MLIWLCVLLISGLAENLDEIEIEGDEDVGDVTDNSTVVFTEHKGGC